MRVGLNRENKINKHFGITLNPDLLIPLFPCQLETQNSTPLLGCCNKAKTYVMGETNNPSPYRIPNNTPIIDLYPRIRRESPIDVINYIICRSVTPEDGILNDFT